MANIRMARLQRDLQDFIEHAPDSVVLTEYDEVGMRFVKFALSGPPDSAYFGAVFHVKMNIPSSFPRAAPKAEFETPVWHPNIGCTGTVCVDVLSDWKMGRTLLQVAVALQSLLALPNPFSPLNVDASLMMRENLEQFIATIKMWCIIFAGGSQSRPEEYQAKVMQVMEAAQVDEETALKRLSRCSWHVQDAILMRRNRH